MKMASWKKQWKELFLKSLEKLPRDLTLSFSGGYDSSIILFGLNELGRKPEHCITFDFNKESSDLHFAQHITNLYDIPLTVIDIPKEPVDKLKKHIANSMKILENSRPIDVQCAYIFDYMFKNPPTNNIVFGFFNGGLYKDGKAISINYSEMKKGIITPEEHQQYYDKVRIDRFETIKHNHHTLKRYVEAMGLNVYAPMQDQDLYEFSLKRSFHDFHYTEDGKNRIKYFLYQLWQDDFDKCGNKGNKASLHVEGGIKEWLTEILTKDTKFKSLAGALNDIFRNKDVKQLY